MPSPYGELNVIVNPHAGRRRVGEEIPELERTLRSRGLAVPAAPDGGSGRRDPPRHARPSRPAGGSWSPWAATARCNEVVNGMFDDEGKPLVPDAVLGVVAAGSGCDFVRTFGLPGDATRAGSPPRRATTRTRSTSAR